MIHDLRYRVENVYWVVGIGSRRRHAVSLRPSPANEGSWIPSQCEVWVRMPYRTGDGAESSSTPITEQCPECVAAVEYYGASAVIWDW